MGCKLCKTKSGDDDELARKQSRIKQSKPLEISVEDEIPDNVLTADTNEPAPIEVFNDRPVDNSTITPNTYEQVEIEVADHQAFNSSFLQQRQRVIENSFYRSSIEFWRPNSIQQLADAIKALSKGKSIIDRHWIIFYWIVINIEYDTVSYFSKNYQDQSAEGVFRTKKGVCAGYGNLYKYLCDELGIRCEIVSGYSKGYGFDDREGAPNETDHAWNAVEIDQHWYLIESTWAAGHLDEQKLFKRELNTYYFLPRPNEMIYHHLPEDDKWQLLREPIKMAQYMQLPKLRPAYFEFDLDLLFPRHQDNVSLMPGKPYAMVIVRTPHDVQIMADLKLHDKKVDGGHRVTFETENQFYRCFFAPATVGKHKITIFGKRGSTDVGSYISALDLTLDIRAMPPNPISYPATWRNFFDLGLRVTSPTKTHMIHVNNGAEHTQILIRTPADVELMGQLTDSQGEMVVGGDRIYYDRQKSFWRCKFAPNHDGVFDAAILARRKSDTGSYTSAITFKIDANQIPTPPLSYPKTWQLFHDLDLKVLGPLRRLATVLLENTSELEIHIRTSEDVALVGRLENINKEEVVGADQIYYDRNKDFWRCKFAPNRDGLFEAAIMAKKKSDSGSYTSAISFKIEARRIPTPVLSYPKTWQVFYDLGLKIEAPRNRSTAVWPENASYAEVSIRAPDDVQLSCRMEYNDTEVKNGTLAQFDSEKQQWQLLFAPQRTGLHELIVFARHQTDTGSSSSSAVMFPLKVNQLRRPIKFPVTYAQFETSKCRIYEPLNGVLKKGSIVPIHCVIPDATDVDVQVDSNWLDTEGYKDPVLKRQVTVGSREVTIYAKYGQNKNYDGLVKYSVE